LIVERGKRGGIGGDVRGGNFCLEKIEEMKEEFVVIVG